MIKATTPLFPPGKRSSILCKAVLESMSKREIARAFNIRGADRTRLNDLLRDMRAGRPGRRGRGRRYGKPGTLPKVGVIEIRGLDH